MINWGLSRAEKFCNRHFMPHGHLKTVKSHGIYSLMLIKMTASYVCFYLDEVISQNGGKSYGCCLKCFPKEFIFLKQKLNPSYIYSLF